MILTWQDLNPTTTRRVATLLNDLFTCANMPHVLGITDVGQIAQLHADELMDIAAALCGADGFWVTLPSHFTNGDGKQETREGARERLRQLVSACSGSDQ